MSNLYFNKYIKYKNKYLSLKKSIGGASIPVAEETKAAVAEETKAADNILKISYGNMIIENNTLVGIRNTPNENFIIYLDNLLKKMIILILCWENNNINLASPLLVNIWKFLPYLKTIGSNAFKKCTNLTEITIPDSISKIGSGAFYECNNLKIVNIPNSVKHIQKKAFEKCKSLTSITIPNSVKTIGKAAFKNCLNLFDLYMIDCDFKGISDELFSGCGSLENVLISSSVNFIGKKAFYNCRNLTQINLDNIKRIKDSAFENCIRLTWIFETFDIPASLRNVDRTAFKNTALNWQVKTNMVRRFPRHYFYF